VPASSDRGRTIRPVPAGVGFWAAVLIGGWAAIAAYESGVVVGLRWTGVVLLVLWLLWLVLWRPRLRVRDDDVTVVNPLRTWTVPWCRVVDVESRLQYVLVTDDGRRITALGTPSPSRPGRPGRDPLDERRHAFIASPRAADAGVEREPIRARFDWWVLAVPVVLLAALAIVVALPAT